MKIVVGEGSCGIAAGAEKVRQALLKQDLNGAKLTIAGCIGMCYLEPIVDIYEDNQEVKRLVRVTENDAEKISEYAKTGDESIISSLLVSDEDKEFLNKQTRIALRRCGIINPDEIDDFVNADGYTAIKKVLTSMTPEDVIEVIKTSGLAGRAVPASRLGLNGTPQGRVREKKSILSAMRTRVIRAHLWTEPLLNPTRILLLKVCLSALMLSVQKMLLFM